MSVRYRLSRRWNRLAYAVIHLGRWMIWDQTGRNEDILADTDFAHPHTEAILCGKAASYWSDKTRRYMRRNTDQLV